MTRNRHFFGATALPWLLLVLLTAGMTACRQQLNTDEPPEIVFGQDVCDQCGMLIGDERFAAAYWTVDGEARRFDDIGGMLAYYHRHSEEVATFWVHDFGSAEWLAAEEATFLLDPEQQTPMGYGIIAFADAEQALARAGTGSGEVVTFDQLIERSASEGLADADSHDH